MKKARTSLFCPKNEPSVLCHRNPYQRRSAVFVQRAVKRFDHSCNQLYNVVRCILLSLFFCRVDGKFFEKVFIHTPDQVFFFAERLVADLVDLIHDLFDVVGRQVARGKSAFHKAAFQRLTVGSDAVQSSIERNIQLRSRLDGISETA